MAGDVQVQPAPIHFQKWDLLIDRIPLQRTRTIAGTPKSQPITEKELRIGFSRHGKIKSAQKLSETQLSNSKRKYQCGYFDQNQSFLLRFAKEECAREAKRSRNEVKCKYFGVAVQVAFAKDFLVVPEKKQQKTLVSEKLKKNSIVVIDGVPKMVVKNGVDCQVTVKDVREGFPKSIFKKDLVEMIYRKQRPGQRKAAKKASYFAAKIQFSSEGKAAAFVEQVRNSTVYTSFTEEMRAFMYDEWLTPAMKQPTNQTTTNLANQSPKNTLSWCTTDFSEQLNAFNIKSSDFSRPPESEREILVDFLPKAYSPNRIKAIFEEFGTVDRVATKQPQQATHTTVISARVLFRAAKSANEAIRALNMTKPAFTPTFEKCVRVRFFADPVTITRPKKVVDQNSNVYVANLPTGTTQAMVYRIFQRYGVIKSLRVFDKQAQDRSRNGYIYALVLFESTKSAVDAINGENDKFNEMTQTRLAVRLRTKPGEPVKNGPVIPSGGEQVHNTAERYKKLFEKVVEFKSQEEFNAFGRQPHGPMRISRICKSCQLKVYRNRNVEKGVTEHRISSFSEKKQDLANKWIHAVHCAVNASIPTFNTVHDDGDTVAKLAIFDVETGQKFTDGNLADKMRKFGESEGIKIKPYNGGKDVSALQDFHVMIKGPSSRFTNGSLFWTGLFDIVQAIAQERVNLINSEFERELQADRDESSANSSFWVDEKDSNFRNAKAQAVERGGVILSTSAPISGTDLMVTGDNAVEYSSRKKKKKTGKIRQDPEIVDLTRMKSEAGANVDPVEFEQSDDWQLHVPDQGIFPSRLTKLLTTITTAYPAQENLKLLNIKIYYRSPQNELTYLYASLALLQLASPVFKTAECIPDARLSMPIELEPDAVHALVSHMHGQPIALPESDKYKFLYIASCYFRLYAIKTSLKVAIMHSDPSNSANIEAMERYADDLPLPRFLNFEDPIASIFDLPSLNQRFM